MAKGRRVDIVGFGNQASRPADHGIAGDCAQPSAVELVADAMRAHPAVPVMREVAHMHRGEGREVDAAMVAEAVVRTRAKYAGEVAARELELRRNGWHEPMIYYMRLGNRVKIGWTQKIHTRLTAIMPEELMALERGGPSDERARHQRFASLRVIGEWFRVEDPLESYIRAVARDFGQDFGVELDAWLAGDRHRAGELGQLPRSRI